MVRTTEIHANGLIIVDTTLGQRGQRLINMKGLVLLHQP